VSTIQSDRTGRVAHIALNRPEKRNALNASLCSELVHAIDSADADSSVGCIVLSGNGPAFCAGMDLREAPACDRLQLAGLHERLFTTINLVRKPIITSVHGPAIAGGTGLVANSHIAIASPAASFGLTEIKVGLWPVLVFRACSLAMGERRTTELSITGRMFTPQEAHAYGLVTEIHEEPLARAMQVAATISEHSSLVLGSGLGYAREIRHLNWEEAGKIGRKMRDRMMEQGDFKEGVTAFLEKRKPG
jgi:enoyl-CoA hydratase/carnithine racemase